MYLVIFRTYLGSNLKKCILDMDIYAKVLPLKENNLH